LKKKAFYITKADPATLPSGLRKDGLNGIAVVWNVWGGPSKAWELAKGVAGWEPATGS
jgi:hypothetical protein